MNQSKLLIRIGIMTAAGIALLSSATGSALAQDVTDAKVKDLLAQAQKQVQQQAGQPAAKAQAPADQPVITLTMEEAVAKAVDQNIDLAVARLTPQIQDFSLAQSKAFYAPTLSGTFGNRSQRTSPANIYGGGALVDSDTLTFNAGLEKQLPWTGGRATLNWTNSRGNSNNQGNTINPLYRADLTATLVQPLLRNRSIDSNRQSLLTAEINRRLSDVTLRASTINTVANTRNAYWDLVYAVQAVDAARQSLALAEKLVEDNKSRVEIGTMAPIEVVSAQSQAASRQLALVQATANRQTAELVLKRLLVGSTGDPMWNATLNPTDRPPAVATDTIDVEAALRRALTERTDLIQARENLKISDVSMKYLKNQTQMGLDLTASYAAAATAGTSGRWVLGEWIPSNPGGLLRRAQDDPGRQAADLERPGQRLLPDRRQRARSQLRPLQGAVPAVDGAAPRARAANCHRHHELGHDRQQQPAAGAVVLRGARAGAEADGGGAEPVRGRDGDQLRGGAGAARPERRDDRGTAGDPQLPEIAGGLPAPAGNLVERVRRRGGGFVGRTVNERRPGGQVLNPRVLRDVAPGDRPDKPGDSSPDPLAFSYAQDSLRVRDGADGGGGTRHRRVWRRGRER